MCPESVSVSDWTVDLTLKDKFAVLLVFGQYFVVW